MNQNKPRIPEKVLEEMTRFFMETSMPRLLEKMEKEQNESVEERS